MQQHDQTMAELTQKASDLRQSHSVEEAIKVVSQKLEQQDDAGHPQYISVTSSNYFHSRVYRIT
ncbi:hypothetical protein GCM10027085_43230 [Spirosoma aerophilum]